MMKKILSVFLVGACYTLHGADFELKIGGFRPNQERMREIYDSVLPSYGAELDVNLWMNQLFIFGEVDYVSTSGHSTYLHSPTYMNLVGLGFGLEYLYPIYDCIELYAGIGPKAYFLNTRDNNFGTILRTSKSNCGGLVKAGAQWNFWSSFFLDAFCEYSYCKINNKGEDGGYIRYDVDVGGVTFGAGLKYSF